MSVSFQMAGAYLGGRLDGALGDFRSDLVSALAVVMGQGKAESTVKGFESLVEARAKEGASAAIPLIRAEVKKTALPFVIGAAAVGALGAALGAIAIVRSRRR